MPKNQTSIELILEDGQVVGATTRVNAALQKVEDKAKHLGEHTSFDKFAEAVKEGIEDPLGAAGAMAEKLLQTMGPVGAGVAAAFSTMAVGAKVAFEAMEGFAHLGVETQNVTLRTGLLTKEVGQFSFAAKAVGADISIVERMMKGLTNAIEGTDAKAETARNALRSMGVDLQGLREGTASTSETLLTISEHLNKMPNVWERNKLMIDLFKKAGIEAIPFIMKLTETMKTAQELGIGLSDEQKEKFLKYQEQLEIVSVQWTRLKRQLMDPIVGVISFVIGDGKDLGESVKRYLKNYIAPGWGDKGGILSRTPGSDVVVDVGEFIRNVRNPPNETVEGFLNTFGTLGPPDKLRPKGAPANWELNYPPSGAALTREQDKTAYYRTLAGAQEHLADATKHAKDAEAAYFSTDAAKKELPDLRKQWEDATAAVAKYKAQVDALKPEKEKKDKDALKLPAGYADSQYAHPRSIVPSLFGPQFAGMGLTGAFLPRPGERGSDSDLSTPAAPPQFTFAPPPVRAPSGAGIGLYSGYKPVEDYERQQEIDRANIEKQVQGMRTEADRQIRVLQAAQQLSAVGKEGPTGELQLAQAILGVRRQEATEELALKGTRADLFIMSKEQYNFDNQSLNARLENEQKILDLRIKAKEEAQHEAEAFGQLLVGFTNAAQQGGSRGVSEFFRGQAHQLQDQLIGNIGTVAFSKVLSPLVPHVSADSPYAPLLAHSPFAAKTADPSLKLSSAGDKQIAAAQALIGAGNELSTAARYLSTGRAGGGGSGGGFGGYGGGGDLTLDDLPINSSHADALGIWASTPAWASQGTAALGAGSTTGAALKSLGGMTAKLKGFTGDMGSGAADPMGILFGKDVSEGGSYTGTATAGQKMGAGLAVAGAAMGAYAGISQIAKGGGHNVAAGIGTTLMSVAPLTGPAAPFVMGAGFAAEVVSMVLGDPRAQRGKAISDFTLGHAYSGPDPVAYSRTLSGSSVGTDMFGNARAVGNNTTINIHAMDSESFGTFLNNHPNQLDAGMYNVFNNGGKSVHAARQQLLGG